MSYINEALKKAQKAKEKHNGHSFALLKGIRGSQKKGPYAGVVRWSLLLLFIIFLAFGTYSWLDSNKKKPSETQTVAPTENKRIKPELPIKKEAISDAQDFYRRARLFHGRGRFENAKKLYQKTLKIDPGHVDALNNLGVLYLGERDYLAAQKSFEKAVRLKPDNADPHYNLACVFALRGEIPRGFAHLEKAISINPQAKDWAQKDNDLIKLRNFPRFKELTQRKSMPE